MDIKLKVGDIIEVHGWCMMEKMDEGQYRVSKIGNYSGISTYSFTKPKGKKVVVTHSCKNVDLWVSDKYNNDLNKITIVSRNDSVSSSK